MHVYILTFNISRVHMVCLCQALYNFDTGFVFWCTQCYDHIRWIGILHWVSIIQYHLQYGIVIKCWNWFRLNSSQCIIALLIYDVLRLDVWFSYPTLSMQQTMVYSNWKYRIFTHFMEIITQIPLVYCSPVCSQCDLLFH